MDFMKIILEKIYISIQLQASARLHHHVLLLDHQITDTLQEEKEDSMIKSGRNQHFRLPGTLSSNQNMAKFKRYCI